MTTDSIENAPRPRSTPRVMQLDILRGIAVLMVLINHKPHYPATDGFWLDDLLLPFSRALWTGVDLFFVLSGYLVGGLLIAELRKSGRIDLKRFWVRRGLKIWPTYYLYLAFLVVVTAVFYVDHSRPGWLRAAFLVQSVKAVYIQNYFQPTLAPTVLNIPGTHTWTLAVEEHFYFILPLVLVALSKRWRTALPIVTLVVFVGCLALRLRHYHWPMDWRWDYQATHIRIDSLFFGVFLAYLSHEHPNVLRWVARRRGFVLASGLLLILPMLVFPLGDPFVKTFGYSCLSLGYGCVLLAVITTEPGVGALGRLVGSRASNALAWVGLWSYSIYIWHVDLMSLFTDLAARWGTVWTFPWRYSYCAVYVVASVALGALLGHLVEKPALVWRDRLFPSRANSAVATGWREQPASGPVPSHVDDRRADADPRSEVMAT